MQKGESAETASLLVPDKHHSLLYINFLHCVQRLYDKSPACNYLASLRDALGQDRELDATPQEEGVQDRAVRTVRVHREFVPITDSVLIRMDHRSYLPNYFYYRLHRDQILS
jgi:hypothetical protein